MYTLNTPVRLGTWWNVRNYYTADDGLSPDAAIVEYSARVLVDSVRYDRSSDAVIRAVRNIAAHYGRFVQQASQRIQPPPLACKAGCSHCCSMTVTATIPEVIAIAAHIRNRTTDTQRTMFLQRINDKAAAIRAAGNNASTLRHTCPLLLNGRCAFYGVRPLACRAWNSYDDNACMKAALMSGNTPKPPLFDQQHNIGGYTFMGLLLGSRYLGVDDRPVELTNGLKTALDNPDAAEMWLQGKAVFTTNEQPHYNKFLMSAYRQASSALRKPPHKRNSNARQPCHASR